MGDQGFGGCCDLGAFDGGRRRTPGSISITPFSLVDSCSCCKINLYELEWISVLFGCIKAYLYAINLHHLDFGSDILCWIAVD